MGGVHEWDSPYLFLISRVTLTAPAKHDNKLINLEIQRETQKHVHLRRAVCVVYHITLRVSPTGLDHHGYALRSVNG